MSKLHLVLNLLVSEVEKYYFNFDLLHYFIKLCLHCNKITINKIIIHFYFYKLKQLFIIIKIIINKLKSYNSIIFVKENYYL